MSQTYIYEINPRPSKPFFVTWFTKGVVTTSLMNLKLTGPKYNCLVPWYRVGSPLSVDSKIMKIGQRMTSQPLFQTCPDSKSGFSVKIGQNWKIKIHFFAEKVPNIGISPGFLLIKKGNGVSNISRKHHTIQIFFNMATYNILRWQPPPTFELWRLTLSPS